FMSRVAKSHPYLDVEPLTANFVQIVEGKGAKQKIKFTNISSMNVRLIPVEAPEDDQIKYKIKDENLKPGESTDLEIELSKKLKPGILKTSITLDAKGAVSERLSIPIQGQIIANP
ncbi:MAG: DUF1573 domain-containing protein, partial [candidate division Zixibacteria bacterium]|nr:DUF1573 domain-containing protein [candidate division Zixibacteria bacterium]